jgi:hypothetical protein
MPGKLSRQQRRSIDRKIGKLKELKANEPDARVIGIRVGMAGPQTVAAGVLCGCGAIFRVGDLPLPDYYPEGGQKPENPHGSSTGEWAVIGCPTCNRAHRLRATVVVVVEEEVETIINPTVTDSGLIVPGPNGKV